jgi:hypothetical protein
MGMLKAVILTSLDKDIGVRTSVVGQLPSEVPNRLPDEACMNY